MHRDPSDRDRGLASARRSKSRSRPPGDSGKQDRLHRKSTEALTRQDLPQHDVSLLDAVHHDPADLRRAEVREALGHVDPQTRAAVEVLDLSLTASRSDRQGPETAGPVPPERRAGRDVSPPPLAPPAFGPAGCPPRGRAGRAGRRGGRGGACRPPPPPASRTPPSGPPTAPP